MTYRPVIIGLIPVLVIAVLLITPDAKPAEAAHNSFILPFDAGLTFRVCQGYESTGTHNKTFALDLTTGSTNCHATATKGKRVRAPFTGTVQGVHFDRGEVCLRTNDGIWMRLVHINYTVSAGQAVSRGQVIGTVAAAGQKDNRGIAHLHIENYVTGSDGIGACANTSDDRPFASTYGTALSGISLPDDLRRSVSGGQHYKKELYRQPVTVYDQVGAVNGPKYTPALSYSGGAMIANVPDLAKISWGDKITSVRVGAGCSVTLYRHPNYGGQSTKLTKTDTDLRNNGLIDSTGALLDWNNRASSLKVNCK
jgi:biotin carboxyl carrier protein